MDKSGSLEGRLDYLEARIEIGDLVAAYGRVIDDRDWQSLGALVSPATTLLLLRVFGHRGQGLIRGVAPWPRTMRIWI